MLTPGLATAVTGAYGLRLRGVDSRWLAVHDATHWPEMTIDRPAVGPSGDHPEVCTESLRATVDAGVAGDELVHPVLGRIALRVTLARGWDAIHAGAIIGPGGAWAIVGAKERGKSSVLAACAEAGIGVLSDDVLIVADGQCLAGPRALDLRPGAAERYGPTVAVRGGTRRRLALPPVRAEVPLAGIVYLEWGGDSARLTRLRGSDTLGRLSENRRQDGFPRHPETLLNLAALPSYELRRPRRWDIQDDVVDRLRGVSG